MSRGLGDVYKRQGSKGGSIDSECEDLGRGVGEVGLGKWNRIDKGRGAFTRQKNA